MVTFTEEVLNGKLAQKDHLLWRNWKYFQEILKGMVTPKQAKLYHLAGIENLRQNLFKSGMSQTAASLITVARSPNTNSNYKLACGKWASSYLQKQIHPFWCPINFVLGFFTHLFEKGYEYRILNNHKSGISACHYGIEGVAVGKHPQVCGLMHGGFNEKPPQPRNSVNWDVQVVLDCIKSNWAVSKELTMKNLSYKLVIL